MIRPSTIKKRVMVKLNPSKLGRECNTHAMGLAPATQSTARMRATRSVATKRMRECFLVSFLFSLAGPSSGAMGFLPVQQHGHRFHTFQVSMQGGMPKTPGVGSRTLMRRRNSIDSIGDRARHKLFLRHIERSGLIRIYQRRCRIHPQLVAEGQSTIAAKGIKVRFRRRKLPLEQHNLSKKDHIGASPPNTDIAIPPKTAPALFSA